MKLIRFGPSGKEKSGVLIDGQRLDVSASGLVYNEDFFANQGFEKLAEWLKAHQDGAPVLGEDVRLGAPICRPSKIICIGLNYSDHAKEAGMTPPSQPVVFFKATSAMVGPNDDLIIPKDSQKTDWEVELAIVIGKKASYVTRERARDYIAGYSLHNDYSERAYQIEHEGQWVKGKSCDTFAPLGPFLASQDEIQDVQDLNLWLTVNGKKMQAGNTKNMIFSCDYIVSYLSQYMTLLPGDVISTGTPAGVGLGFDPPIYIKPNDVIELGIDGLGSSKQVAKSYTP